MSIGIGVKINILAGSGENSRETFKSCIGKKIASIGIDENKLIFTFTDGAKMAVFDDGQSCCEHRYMHTDDDLSSFVGAQLWNAEIREGPDETEEYGEVKETEFLVITTSYGQFTVCNYNEHNGYYGGFFIVAKMIGEL